MQPFDLRARIRSQMDAAVGAHDEPEIYADALGDLGLTGPGSMSWELHSDMGVVAAAGLGAIIMEILHPAVMAGVHDLSNYQTQPERRMRNTFGYVLVTTFASTDAATSLIDRVRRMHERVNGTMPDGRPYRAMDPELIGWVHNAIPWAIMLAYEAYHRPLTIDEKNQYLSEQAVIAKLSGAGDIPTSVAELDDYVEAMRPQLVVNEQTLGFLGFMMGPKEGTYRAGELERQHRKLAMRASMRLLPEWARQLAGLDHSEVGRRLWYTPTTELNVRLIRWAYGMPACRRLAEGRVAATMSTRERDAA
jgi:uncharacterized protein (DUF2236 family)